MMLYEIPRGSLIRAQTTTDNNKTIVGEFITFHYIDGMYSYCTVYGSHLQHVINLSANTELEKIADYYIII